MPDAPFTPNTPLEDPGQLVDGSILFRRHGVQPPSSVYVTEDDTITVQVFAPNVTTTVNISLRYLTPRGEIIPEFYTFVGVAGGTFPQSFTLNGSEGFLLSATITAAQGQKGECFVALVLKRGQGTSDATLGQLIVQGYIPPSGALAFPQSPATAGVDGRARIRVFLGSAPAAGAETLDTVPPNSQWILRSYSVLFTTAAAVANRQPSLVVDDGAGNIIGQWPLANVLTATLATRLTWSTAPNNVIAGGFACTAGIALELRLQHGWRMRTLTSAIQAADQYAAPSIYVEELINA